MHRLTLVKDKNFYKKVLSIVIPVAAQQAIDMGVNMMDTIMLGSFGEVQLSASSLANSFYAFYSIMCMGIIGGCSVLVAQYWGAKNLEKARETFSLALRLAVLLGAVFSILTWLFPAGIMRLFTHEEAVVAQGVRYLKVTAFIYLIHGTSLVTSFLMRSVRQPKLGLWVSIVSFVVNVFANWVFIFGNLGAPRLEIAGAALGTLIARCAEFVVTFVYVLAVDKKLCLRPKNLIANPTRELVDKYLKMGLPALLSDSLLGFGNTALSMILGRMGANIVAANSICQVVDRLVTVVVGGVANAASIITGNTIGEGKKEEALAEGETFYVMSVVMGIINGILVLVVGPLTLRLYALKPETIAVTEQMMMAYAFITVFQNIQSVMTKGVLRGGGDTRFLLVADILFLWVVSLPLGAFVGLVLHAPGWITIICLRIDFVIKSIWCVSRLLSRKWIREVNAPEALESCREEIDGKDREKLRVLRTK